MSDNPSKAAVWAWVSGRIVRGGGTWSWAKSGPSRESRTRENETVVRRAVNLWAGVGDRALRNGVSIWAVGYTSRACKLLVSSTLYVFYSPLIRDNLWCEKIEVNWLFFEYGADDSEPKKTFLFMSLMLWSTLPSRICCPSNWYLLAIAEVASRIWSSIAVHRHRQIWITDRGILLYWIFKAEEPSANKW